MLSGCYGIFSTLLSVSFGILVPFVVRHGSLCLQCAQRIHLETNTNKKIILMTDRVKPLHTKNPVFHDGGTLDSWLLHECSLCTCVQERACFYADNAFALVRR